MQNLNDLRVTVARYRQKQAELNNAKLLIHVKKFWENKTEIQVYFFIQCPLKEASIKRTHRMNNKCNQSKVVRQTLIIIPFYLYMYWVQTN